MQRYLWFFESQKVELEAEPSATKLLSCVISSQYGSGRQSPSPYLKVISTHSSLIEHIVRAGSGKSWATFLLKRCRCWLIFVQSYIIYIPCNNYGCIRMLSVCIGRGGVDDVTGCHSISWWRDVNSNDRCEFLRQTVGTHPHCEQFNVWGKETSLHMHVWDFTTAHSHAWRFPLPFFLLLFIMSAHTGSKLGTTTMWSERVKPRLSETQTLDLWYSLWALISAASSAGLFAKDRTFHKMMARTAGLCLLLFTRVLFQALQPRYLLHNSSRITGLSAAVAQA